MCYLYSRIAFLVSVLVDMGLLYSLGFGGRLGGLGADGQWREG